jgi:hypothetical protein
MWAFVLSLWKRCCRNRALPLSLDPRVKLEPRCSDITAAVDFRVFQIHVFPDLVVNRSYVQSNLW